MAGLPTTAAARPTPTCRRPDAPVVRALVAAGAVVVGKTNLDQFATGLVGTRSPYGVVPERHWPGLVSGGSSSGSAVAVAAGAGRPRARHRHRRLGPGAGGRQRHRRAQADAGPAQHRRRGAGRAARSTACRVFARDRRPRPPGRRPRWPPAPTPTTRGAGPRRAHPAGRGRAACAAARAASPSTATRRRRAAMRPAVAALAAATGAEVRPTSTSRRSSPPAGCSTSGAFVAERYDAVGAFIDDHPDDVDPVVDSIIRGRRDVPAWQVFAATAPSCAALAAPRRRRCGTPSTCWSCRPCRASRRSPRCSPTRSASTPMLGTYTNFVNLLDLVRRSTMPVGLPAVDGPPAEPHAGGAGRPRRRAHDAGGDLA